MADRLTEKYGDLTRVPLKTTEVTPGIPRSTLQQRIIGRKFALDKEMSYIAKDGSRPCTWDDLQAANDLWYSVYLRKISRR